MENLPIEISLNIFSRLPISSLILCKLVCKVWRNLAQHPCLRNLHVTYQQSHGNPSFILHYSNPYGPQDSLYLVNDIVYENNDNDSDIGNAGIKKIVTPFKNYMYKFSSVLSCNGLLCVSYSEQRDLPKHDQICIYNPFTADFTFLPDPSIPDALEYKAAYSFGFDPCSKEYKVVRIVDVKYIKYQKMEVITLGSSLWRTIEHKPFILPLQPSAALVNGALHWLDTDKVDGSLPIVSFDLLGEKLSKVAGPDCRLEGCQLGELAGLLTVVKGYGMEEEKLDVWLMKDYGVKDSWDKRFTIKLYIADLPRTHIRPLCLLKNGKILFECHNQFVFPFGPERVVFSYDPESKTLVRLKIGDLPMFRTIPHLGSLISPIR